MQMESKREPAVMGNKPLLGPRVLLKQVFYRKLRQWTYSKKVWVLWGHSVSDVICGLFIQSRKQMEVSGAGQGTCVELPHKEAFTTRMCRRWIFVLVTLGYWGNGELEILSRVSKPWSVWNSLADSEQHQIMGIHSIHSFIHIVKKHLRGKEAGMKTMAHTRTAHVLHTYECIHRHTCVHVHVCEHRHTHKHTPTPTPLHTHLCWLLMALTGPMSPLVSHSQGNWLRVFLCDDGGILKVIASQTPWCLNRVPWCYLHWIILINKSEVHPRFKDMEKGFIS